MGVLVITKKYLLAILLIGALIQCISCGGSSALPQTSIPAPSLTSAYPSDLAVASPYASDSTSSSLSLVKQINKTLLDNPGATYQEKKAAFSSIIEATSVDGCAFNLNLNFSEDRAACYGPEIEYTNHPDTLFGQNGAGRLPHGDLGLWDELSDDGNACAASQMNALFSNVSGQVDSALGLFASTLCVASNNDIGLPDENTTTDLTTLIKNTFSSLSIDLTIENASMTRNANNANGKAVYEMEISGKDTANNTVSFSLQHIPLDDDNETYQGKLAFSIANSNPGFTINCGLTSGSTSAASILYEKTSATSLTYQLNRADFCGVNVDPFDANNNIDPSDKFDQATNSDGWANNYNRAIINVNPDTGESTVSYAWQAGANDDNTRVFEASVVSEDNLLSGCAYYGFGDDVANTDNISINGFICNWAGPGSEPFGEKTLLEKAQRQCVTQNATGLFDSDSDTLNIAYAPTNSCDSVGGSFTFDGNSGAFTNTLINLDEIVYEAPEAPSEI